MISRSARQYDPDVGPRIPLAPAVVAQERRHLEAGFLETPDHLRHRERAERQRERPRLRLAAAPLRELLIEDRQPLRAVLSHRLRQGDVRAARPAPPALEADALLVFLP